MKLNGYRVSHRNKWRFIEAKILSIQELTLLEFYADIFDFDKKHKTYGTFEVNYEEIAKTFSCHPNSIRERHKKLLKIGFIKKVDKRGRYLLNCFERYILPGKWDGKASDYAKSETNQEIGVILRSFGIDLQSFENKLQPDVEKIQSVVIKSDSKVNTKETIGFKAIGSSKDQSNCYPKKVIIKSDPKSFDKCKEESKEYRDLNANDIMWINQNVQEIHEVSNKQLEEEIVEIFFDNDWNKYQRNLLS